MIAVDGGKISTSFIVTIHKLSIHMRGNSVLRSVSSMVRLSNKNINILPLAKCSLVG